MQKQVRKFDIFGSPIGLTYNGNSTFQTALGGCAALLILLMLGGTTLQQVLDLYVNRSYNSKTSTQYIEYT